MKNRLIRRISSLTLCLSLFTSLSMPAYAAETVQSADSGIGPGYETVYDKERASAASDNRNTETPEEKKTALPGESLGIFRISASVTVIPAAAATNTPIPVKFLRQTTQYLPIWNVFPLAQSFISAESSTP